MVVNQRDVFFLPHPFGDQHGEPHPHIVLSVQEANQHEQTFIAVMITSSPFTKDDYSFELVDEMFEKPLPKKGSHVRMHLMTLSFDECIIPPKMNTMRMMPFRELMKSIGDLIFNFNFLPQK